MISFGPAATGGRRYTVTDKPEHYGTRVPAQTTLSRYGLSLDEWKKMVERHGGACWVCGRVPESGRLVIDHEHVRGWKAMPPECRKGYVRGVCCVTCNHFVLTRYGTPEKFRNAAGYLEDYNGRSPWLPN